MKVKDAVEMLEKSVEEYGLMRTGVRVNRILNLLRQCDPKLHNTFLAAWYIILYF